MPGHQTVSNPASSAGLTGWRAWGYLMLAQSTNIHRTAIGTQCGAQVKGLAAGPSRPRGHRTDSGQVQHRPLSFPAQELAGG